MSVFKFKSNAVPFFSRFTACLVAFAALALSVSCTKGSNPVQTEEYGMIEIRARMVNPPLAKSAGGDGVAATVADKIVIEVSGNDLAPTRIEQKLDFSRPTVIDTVKKVPVGKSRRISIWAIDKSGGITHIDSVETRVVNIEAAVVTPVSAALIPAAGSIYLNFAGLSTGMTRVHATFTDAEGTVIAENDVARAARTFLSLDGIPHNTQGVLRVSVIDAYGDTVYIASRELKFDARGDNTIDLQFMENSGMIMADVTVHAPGATVASYNFGNQESAVVETGELVITEIMWNAGNDNYIELYNTTGETLVFDELITDVDGTARSYPNVTIAADGYFVIGRQAMAHANVYAPTTAGLAITATGNFITVKRKNGAILDRVVHPGSNSALGWPSVSGKRSIELDRDKYDAALNNFGKNWRVTSSTVPIPGTTDQYGTPGR